MIGDFKCGVIAVDPEESEGGLYEIVHLALFTKPPIKEELDGLREELRTDPEFGVGEAADRLMMIYVPDGMLEALVKAKDIEWDDEEN